MERPLPTRSLLTSSQARVAYLKELIKAKKTPRFNDIAADELSLWRVKHPVIAANKHIPVLLRAIDGPTELDPTDDIADVFSEAPPKKTIHIIVQRPPPPTGNETRLAD
jgi:hypothetical protein